MKESNEYPGHVGSVVSQKKDIIEILLKMA
jgi:hypothetical protein